LTILSTASPNYYTALMYSSFLEPIRPQDFPVQSCYGPAEIRFDTIALFSIRSSYPIPTNDDDSSFNLSFVRSNQTFVKTFTIFMILQISRSNPLYPLHPATTVIFDALSRDFSDQCVMCRYHFTKSLILAPYHSYRVCIRLTIIIGPATLTLIPALYVFAIRNLFDFLIDAFLSILFLTCIRMILQSQRMPQLILIIYQPNKRTRLYSMLLFYRLFHI